MTPRQGAMFRSTAGFCEGLVAPDSIYALLHRECFALLPDEMFADLFTGTGRRSVPPMIVAVGMVPQRLGGPSDPGGAAPFPHDGGREDAAGGVGVGYPGFVHEGLGRHSAGRAPPAAPRPFSS